MNIELKQTEELNGDIWYRVYVDGSCDVAFKVDHSFPDGARSEAFKYYNKIVSRLKDGYPKTNIVASESI